MTQTRIIVVISLLALASGCHRQRTVLVVPGSAQAAEVVPNAVPAIPEVVMTSKADLPRQSEPQQTPSKVADARTNRGYRRIRPKKNQPPPVNAAAATPTPPVVAENHVPDPPIITTNANVTEDVSRESTERLLDEAQRNLVSIRRSLSNEEKTMQQQVVAFSKDARDALKADDLPRAHNLAAKAQLLSAALARAR